jgi:hypothetical protein
MLARKTKTKYGKKMAEGVAPGSIFGPRLHDVVCALTTLRDLLRESQRTFDVWRHMMFYRIHEDLKSRNLGRHLIVATVDDENEPILHIPMPILQHNE